MSTQEWRGRGCAHWFSKKLLPDTARAVCELPEGQSWRLDAPGRPPVLTSAPKRHRRAHETNILPIARPEYLWILELEGSEEGWVHGAYELSFDCVGSYGVWLATTDCCRRMMAARCSINVDRNVGGMGIRSGDCSFGWLSSMRRQGYRAKPVITNWRSDSAVPRDGGVGGWL